MNAIANRILTALYELFTTTLFHIGGTSVSLSSIVQLILSLLIVFFLARAFKNVLKSRLLVRVGIDEGNREAIATIVSYATGTLGVIVILQTSGFNLASLAVIAGGLGVGLGLGLQDATKNFISGLTLLLEGTIRVGDFVEFDGLSGYVKEISIRSTIIRTRDGGDVVVPNSQMVENRLMNWSYDSFKARMHIPVGVAYESEPVLVTEILLKSAYMEAAVLHDPAPKVIFMGFGESSLDFELWVWVSRIDKDPDIRSSLNFIIEHNLRQQGISIPYPQRDLWLRNPEVLTRKVRKKVEDTPDFTSLPQPQLLEKRSKPLSLRDLLREVTYFENFTNLELRRLIELGYRKRLRASEVLFREGDAGNAFYIILSGSVEVVAEKLNKYIKTLKAGQFFGELSLMLGIPRTATVRALEDTIVFVINNKSFEKLLQEHPELAEVIAREFGNRQEEVFQRQQQLRELGLLDAAEDEKNPVAWVRKRLKDLFNL